MSDVTEILSRIESGDQRAAAQLLPLLYDELRQLAAQRIAQEKSGHTLQATALVHEAYLRLIGNGDIHWDGRGHFFAAAAEAMRRILIEQARAKKSKKRGGDRQRVDLSGEYAPITLPSESLDELLELNEALEKFAEIDPQKAELVKLLYFAGLNLDEAAALQGIGRTTAYRYWLFARAWLRDAMHASPSRE